MEEPVPVLSDVLVGFRSNYSASDECYLGKFEYSGHLSSVLITDGDGDVVVPRKTRLCLFHARETLIPDVGLQIWRGALILADWIVENSGVLRDQIVLEFGAGIGTAGLVAAAFAHRVYLTDYHIGSLRLALRNCAENAATFCTGEADTVRVRVWDWNDAPPYTQRLGAKQTMTAAESVRPHQRSDYEQPEQEPQQQQQQLLLTGRTAVPPQLQWRAEDIEELRRVGVVLAADVVYDDAISDVFLLTLRDLLATTGAYAIVSMEKRVNFSLDTLREAAPAYEFFLERVRGIFSLEPLPLPPQHLFPYNRGSEKYLFLWKVTLCADAVSAMQAEG